jgi:hypothetical protein
MKQIRIWKMIVIYVVTLGVYGIVWLARRRNELARTTKLKLLPNSMMYGAIAGITVIIAGLTVATINFDTLGFSGLIATYSIAAVFALCVSFLFLWWLWFFLIASTKVVGPRLNLGWLLAHAIITGFSYMFVLQYYFNRKPVASQKSPSKKFVNWSIALFVVYLAGSAAYGAVLGFTSAPRLEVKETPVMQELSRKSQLLYKKYEACAQEINKVYEVVTDETEVAYLKAYDDCEAVRVEQNKAAEEYTKLYKEAQTK